MRFAAIADDLTSAAETAGQLVAAGGRADVLFHLEDLDDTEGACLDLDSRIVHTTEAARRVAAAAERMRGARILYKTMDSTLRGHVATELVAALRHSGRRRAVVAPAFPAYGRTTAGGIQRVDGAPVQEGAAGRDPAHPVTTSSVVELLAGLPDVVVADALTDADLDAVVASVPDPAEVLWSGSPGLSQALLRVHPPEPADPPPDLAGAGPVLVVVGSLNPVSRRQRDELVARNLPGVTVLATDDAPQPDGMASLVAAVAAACAACRDLRLVLTGGETARAVAETLGAHGLQVYGEAAPGVPYGMLRGAGHIAATKAGGFGRDDELARLARLLGSA